MSSLTSFGWRMFFSVSSGMLLSVETTVTEPTPKMRCHSDIGTTANIYSHLDYKSKITSANVMDNILTLPDTRQTGWHT